MAYQELSQNISEQLRRSGALSADDLYSALGGQKAIDMDLASFREFVDSQCKEILKKSTTGDENTSPKYALENRVVRKRSTMKKRSTSKSGARVGTSEDTQYKPREHGAYSLFGVVRHLAIKSSNGVISWNDIRNLYRKKTKHHLTSEELNMICGTTNETKANLIKNNPIMNSFLVPLDDKCQMVRLAHYQPGDPPAPTPSPIASHGHSSPLTSGQVSPTVQRYSDSGDNAAINNADIDAKRQEVLKNLEMKGIRLSADGKVARDSNGASDSPVAADEVTADAVFPRPSSESDVDIDICENDEVFKNETTGDVEPVDNILSYSHNQETTGVLCDRTNDHENVSERDYSASTNNTTMNVAFLEGDSQDQMSMSMSASFLSAMDSVTPTPAETSGEQGYTTGAEDPNLSLVMSDADVSLNMAPNSEMDEEEPRTPIRSHEITLCSSRNDRADFQMPQPDVSPVCLDEAEEPINIHEPSHHVSPKIAATIKKLQSQGSASSDVNAEGDDHDGELEAVADSDDAPVSDTQDSSSSTCVFEPEFTAIPDPIDQNAQQQARENFLQSPKRNSMYNISEVSGDKINEELISNHSSSSNVSEGLPGCDAIVPRERDDALTASIVTIIERHPSEEGGDDVDVPTAVVQKEKADDDDLKTARGGDNVDTDSEDIPYDTEADDSQPASPNVRTITVEVELEKPKKTARQESAICVSTGDSSELNATVQSVKAFLSEVENSEKQCAPEKQAPTVDVETLSPDAELKPYELTFEPRDTSEIENTGKAEEGETDKKTKKEKKKVRVVAPRRRLINCCSIL